MGYVKKVNIEELRSMKRMALTPADVAEDLRHTYRVNGMDFTKDLGLKGKFCYHPFNTVTIDHQGDCYMCVCQAWLPVPVGNIMDFKSIKEIVKTAKAREIQASIVDGTFRYCDQKTCHLLVRNELETKIDHKPDTINWIVFAVDDSCNLQCPSCRTDLIFHKEGEKFEFRKKMMRHIAKLINNHDHYIRFTLSGDGDPFASHIYRALLKNLRLTKQQQVEIEMVTNGILVKRYWKEMPGVHENVYRFKISFDAGTPEVYKITRRGGSWKKLIDSTRYLVEWKKQTNSKMQIVANYVVQNENYRDIVAFVKLMKEIGVDQISFQKVTDWGKYYVNGINFFQQHAVWMEGHPNFNELCQILQDPELYDPRIELTNLSHLGQKHPDRPDSTTK